MRLTMSMRMRVAQTLRTAGSACASRAKLLKCEAQVSVAQLDRAFASKKNVIMRLIEFRIFCSAFETGKGDSERRAESFDSWFS